MARREIKRPVSEEDIRKWEEGWSEMMVKIWREKILDLHIVDTMRLHNSMSYAVQDLGGQIQIAHEFMLYGIYVARGVGSGYRRDNGGNLEFLDPDYRRQHGLNKPRKKGPAWGGGYTSGKPRTRRDWFTPRYLSSINVLTEVEMQMYGEAYMGTLSNVVAAMFSNVEVKGDSGTVITPTIARF